jgi:hypothetical protein
MARTRTFAIGSSNISKLATWKRDARDEPEIFIVNLTIISISYNKAARMVIA